MRRLQIASRRPRISRSYRFSSANALGGGTLLEQRFLAAAAFYRPLSSIGQYTKWASTYVPDDTLAGPIVINPGPAVATSPGGVLTASSQGSFGGINQTSAATIVDGVHVPPYSSTTTSSAEFAVHHGHAESGQSFGAAAGLLNVATRATGNDSWAVADWDDATVTVEFLINASVPSNYSYTYIDIHFQSTYFGFSLVGDSNQATLTLMDGSGQTTSVNNNFFALPGLGAGTTNFTVPAVAAFGATYDSYMSTDFAGPGFEPLREGAEQQFIDWNVSFTLN